MKRKLTIAGMILIAAAALAAGCSKGRAPEVGEPSAAPVESELLKVEKKQVRDTYVAVGTVRSETTVTISSKIMGFVKDLRVSVGDVVAKGQLLMTIDAPEISAKVNQANAGLDEAQRALEEVESGIAGSEAGLAAAQAGFDLAESTFNRFEKLVNEDSVSRQEFDEVKAKRAVAAAELDQAKKGLTAMQAKKRQVEAKINQAQAGASEARIMLNYSSVTSPINGIVLEKNIETGALASPGMPLLTIEDNSAYRLETVVDESRIGGIKAGDRVEVKIDAISDKQLEGGVVEIRPSADAGSRSFTVKVALPADERLRSGMFGRASFDMGVAEKILLPSSALVTRGLVKGVYIVEEGGTARFSLVKTGEPDADGNVEVFSGLAGGEMVARSNVETINDGGKVQVR